MQQDDYLPLVRQQYEELPYPERRPEDEKRRLIHTYPGNLFVINHFCFGGRMDFRSGFRCLVAGGGTGDGVIYLAEQLRHFDAEIVYLDLSTASRGIAEARARARGLTNITWITDSIMALPRLGLGQFDYIKSVGVLHHLASTEAGLECLTRVLKPTGGIYLMLYGKYGRRPVYDMQALMREYLPAGADIRDKIARARQLLDTLPATNSFQRDRARWSDEIAGDAGLYDLLLHSQDRCFTIREIHELAATVGFSVLGFGGPHARLYDPLLAVHDPQARAHIAGLDLAARQAIGELLNGNIACHEFFLGRDPACVASPDDEDNALMAIGSMYQKAPEIAASMAEGRSMTYDDGSHLSLRIDSDPLARIVYAEMRGRTPLSAIYQRIRREVPGVGNREIRQRVRQIYEELHSYGYLYLLKAGSHGVTTPDFDRLLAETAPKPSHSQVPNLLLKKPRPAR